MLHQAATGVLIRYHDNPFRIQDFCRLSHEPDAAECDDIAFQIPGLPRKLQAVTDDIGDFLNLRFLVMMRQDDRPGGPVSGPESHRQLCQWLTFQGRSSYCNLR